MLTPCGEALYIPHEEFRQQLVVHLGVRRRLHGIHELNQQWIQVQAVQDVPVVAKTRVLHQSTVILGVSLVDRLERQVVLVLTKIPGCGDLPQDE